MKKIMALVAVFALTSCSATEPIPTKGEIVSCSSIQTGGAGSTSLSCLDNQSNVTVDSIKGPALINVWGTWCGPCRQELPHLAHFYAQYKGKVEIVGVAVEEVSQANVEDFVLSHGMTWPILYDKFNATRGQFGMAVPVTWFVNSSGEVVHKKYGPFNSTEEIQLDVQKYLGVK